MMRRLLTAITLWVILWLSPLSQPVAAPATDEPDTTFAPAIVDTTHIITKRLDRIDRLRLQTSFVTYIDVASLRGPNMRLGDLLAKTTGLQVRSYGGPGSMSTVSVRGINPGRVEIYIDNVPLRSAAAGAVDLSSIDLANIESIEIYRSAPPEALGGEAAGAAIRLRTRSGGERHFTAHFSGGSFGTYTAETTLAGHLADTDFYLSAAHFESNGDFDYFYNNGTEHNPADDQTLSWSNGDLSRQSLFGKLNYSLTEHLRLSLSSQAWWSDQGVPGTSRRPTEKTQQVKHGHLEYLEINFLQPWYYPVELNLNGFAGREDRHFKDPLRELGITGARTQVDHELDRRGGSIGGSISGFALPRLGWHRFELLADTRHEQFDNIPPPGGAAEDKRRRTAGTLSAGDRVEFFDDRLHLDLFYRWERGENNYHGHNPWRPFVAVPTHITEYQGPRLGLRWSLGTETTFKANYATDARYPTFTELFGYEGTIQGNPNLVPEQGERWDIGGSWHPLRGINGVPVRLDVAYYQSRLEEMIVFITVSDRETKPVNLDQAAIKGAELNLTATLIQLPRFELELTTYLDWQETRDEGASPIYHGNELTYHPRWRGGGRLTLACDKWSLRHSASYRGSVYWGRSNLPEYQNDGFWDHELLLRWRSREELTLSLRFANLFNQELEDIRGYPQPGRALYGGLELNL
jgi:outer membrane cobalamin receptor